MSANNGESGTGPIRGPDGKFVSLPDSMPKRYRPDTPGSALHVYRDRSDAQEMLSNLPHATRVKTVKRDGKVEHHIQHKQVDGERGGAGIEIEVTCPCKLEDFS